MIEIESTLKTKFNKKKLSEEQKNIINTIAETIATNEQSKDWINKVKTYISQPSMSMKNIDEVSNICETHGVDYKTALMIFHSK